MNFKLINNHILLTLETNLGDKVCVFDTGSPFTFFFDNVSEYSIDGKVYSIRQNPKAAILAQFNSQFNSQIEEMIGVAIDGFIGTDSIANSSIVINFPNKELHITSDTLQLENSIGMRDIHGLPIFEISINGIVLRAAFDSGAMYSFVSSHIVDKLGLKPLNQTIMDFNPMFGAFEISLFNGEIKVGETNLGLQTIAIGSGYDQSLQILGINAFIGIDALKNSEVGISFIERCIDVK
jgi:hypothetical protein